MRAVVLPVLLLGLVAGSCSATEWQLTTGVGPNKEPSWCGDEIVFQSNRSGGIDIWCMDEAGEASGIRPITQTSQWFDERPVWSSGCDSVCYQSCFMGGATDIYRVSSLGPPHTPVALTTDMAAYDMEPDASGDGIVFTSNRSGDDVYWMDSRGEAYGLSRLTTDAVNDRCPAWSPDGSHVAFMSNRGGVTSIWVMDSRGEGYGIERYTDAPEADLNPAWSPDGQYIAFGRDGVGIFTIDVTTREERQVTSGYSDDCPAWSPDGSHIAFMRLGAVNYDIWSTDNVPDTAVRQASWGSIKAVYRQAGGRLPN